MNEDLYWGPEAREEGDLPLVVSDPGKEDTTNF